MRNLHEQEEMVFTNDEPGQSSSAIDKAPKEIKETASIKPFSRPGKLEGELQDLENVTSEENPECRVCRMEASKEQPLFTPCRCRGSIRYVHQECLVKWMKQRNDSKCEVCAFPFKYRFIYAAGAPAEVRLWELCAWIFRKTCVYVPRAAYWAVIIFVWIFLAPLFTWRVFRLFLANSWSEASEAFMILTDASKFHLWGESQLGLALCVVIIVSGIILSSLRDFIIDEHNEFFDWLQNDADQDLFEVDVIQGEHENERQHQNDQEQQENLVFEEAAFNQAFENEVVGPAPTDTSASTVRNSQDSGSGEGLSRESEGEHKVEDFEVEDESVKKGGNERVVGHPLSFSLNATRDGIHNQTDNRYAQNVESLGLPSSSLGKLESKTESEHLGDNIQNIPISQHAEEKQPEVQMAGGGHAEGLQDGEGLEDGGMNEEDAAAVREALLGEGEVAEWGEFLQYPFSAAFGIYLWNIVFLLCVVFVPVNTGRLLFWIFDVNAQSLSRRWLLSTLTNFVGIQIKNDTTTAPFESPVLPVNTTGVQGLTLGSFFGAIMGAVSRASELFPSKQFETVLNSTLTNNSTFEVSEGVMTLNSDTFQSLHSSLRVEDVLAMAAGYTTLAFLVSCFFFMVVAATPSGQREEELQLWRQLPKWLRMTRRIAVHSALIAKAEALLLVELTVFPVFLGWAGDLLTLDLFESSLSQRVSAFNASPILSLAFHWALGVSFMLQISYFASLLRKVLRREVLCKILRYPDDPDFHPVQELARQPLPTHLRRLALSVFVYFVLVVLGTHVPCKLYSSVWPSLSPLRIRLSEPAEIPADVLLLHFFAPFVIDRLKLPSLPTRAMRVWFEKATAILGLRAYLMIPVEEKKTGKRKPEDEGTERAEVDPNLEATRQIAEIGPQASVKEQDSEREHTPEAAADEAKNDTRTQEEENPHKTAEISHFSLRIFVLLVLLWLSQMAFVGISVIFPLFLGRAALSQLRPLKAAARHDLYACVLGTVMVLMTGSLLSKCYKQLQSRGIWKSLPLILDACVLGLKWLFLSFFAFGVVPLLVGLVIELSIIIPVRVPVDESPCLFIHQDWAIGLVALKFGIRIVRSGFLPDEVHELNKAKLDIDENPETTAQARSELSTSSAGSRADKNKSKCTDVTGTSGEGLGLGEAKLNNQLATPNWFPEGVDEGKVVDAQKIRRVQHAIPAKPVTWKEKLDTAAVDGFKNVRAHFVFFEIICPLVFRLLLLLVIPYVFSVGIVPLIPLHRTTASLVAPAIFTASPLAFFASSSNGGLAHLASTPTMFTTMDALHNFEFMSSRRSYGKTFLFPISSHSSMENSTDILEKLHPGEYLDAEDVARSLLCRFSFSLSMIYHLSI